MMRYHEVITQRRTPEPELAMLAFGVSTLFRDDS